MLENVKKNAKKKTEQKINIKVSKITRGLIKWYTYTSFKKVFKHFQRPLDVKSHNKTRSRLRISLMLQKKKINSMLN